MMDNKNYTGARVTRKSHAKVTSAARKYSAELDRPVTLREIYSALAEHALTLPQGLTEILRDQRYAEGE
jgi:hypothetical protein